MVFILSLKCISFNSTNMSSPHIGITHRDEVIVQMIRIYQRTKIIITKCDNLILIIFTKNCEIYVLPVTETHMENIITYIKLNV